MRLPGFRSFMPRIRFSFRSGQLCCAGQLTALLPAKFRRTEFDGYLWRDALLRVRGRPRGRSFKNAADRRSDGYLSRAESR